METKTLEMLRAAVKSAWPYGPAPVNTDSEDAMVTWIAGQFIDHEIKFYLSLTGDRGMWANTIGQLMEQIIRENPSAPDSEIARLTLLKFKEETGFEAYFAGRDDDHAGMRLAHLFRIKKQYMGD